MRGLSRIMRRFQSKPPLLKKTSLAYLERQAVAAARRNGAMLQYVRPGRWFDDGIGPELVTNGTFDAGTAGWTGGADVAVVSGELQVTANQYFNIAAEPQIAVVPGKTYRVRAKVRGGSASAIFSVRRSDYTYPVGNINVAAGETRIVDTTFTASASTTAVWLRLAATAGAGNTAFFDDVSIREVWSNILGPELIPAVSSAFDTGIGAWTTTSGGSWDATERALKITTTATNYPQSNLSIPAPTPGKTYVASFDLWSPTGMVENVAISYGGNTVISLPGASVPLARTRFTRTFTASQAAVSTSVVVNGAPATAGKELCFDNYTVRELLTVQDGPELAPRGGTFDDGSTAGWNPNNGNALLSAAGGQFSITNGAAGQEATAAVTALTAGRVVRIAFDVISGSGAVFTQAGRTSFSGTGRKTFHLLTSMGNYVGLGTNVTTLGAQLVVDNVSIVECGVIDLQAPVNVYLGTDGSVLAKENDPVGLVIDQAGQADSGLRGPELVTSGDFSVPAAWVTGVPVDVANISGGKLNVTAFAAGGSVLARQNLALEANKTYEIRIQADAVSGNYSWRLSDSSSGEVAVPVAETTTGLKTYLVTPSRAVASVQVVARGSGLNSGTFDNVSVREVIPVSGLGPELAHTSYLGAVSAGADTYSIGPGVTGRFLFDATKLRQGATYEVSFEVVSVQAAGTFTADWCDVVGYSGTSVAVGRYTFRQSRAAYDSTFRFVDILASASASFTIKAPTVREVGGSQATQATTNAKPGLKRGQTGRQVCVEDGSDDSFMTQIYTGTSGTMIAAVRPATMKWQSPMGAGGQTSGTKPGVALRMSAPGQIQLGMSNASNATQPVAPGTYAVGEALVIEGYWSPAVYGIGKNGKFTAGGQGSAAPSASVERLMLGRHGETISDFFQGEAALWCHGPTHMPDADREAIARFGAALIGAPYA